MVDVLRQLIIKDVFANQHVVTIKPDDTINHAFQLLINGNIQSAPVITEHEDGSRTINLIDILDIVRFVVDLYSVDEAPLERDIHEMVRKAGGPGMSPRMYQVAAITGLAKKPAVPVVTDKASLADVAEALAAGHHRVLVVNHEGQLNHFVTQSAVTDLIYQNKDKLGQLLNKSVFDLSLGAKTVITASSKEPAINAFKLLADNLLSAVPVVDPEGEIIGVISAKDLKTVAIQKEMVKRLYMTAQDFLKTKEKEFAGPRTVVCCKVTDTFEQILHKLHENRIHRIFIVNDFYHPIGIVALQDVLNLLLNWDIAQAKKMLHVKEEQQRHHVVL